MKYGARSEPKNPPPHPSAILQSDFDHVKILTWLEVEGENVLSSVKFLCIFIKRRRQKIIPF